jgi:membrane-bound metal-dependent hydrolase YbcI (DUF457 family)
VEPFTHAFTSLALARGGRHRLPRFGTAMMIVAGLAPDLDYISYVMGPSAFLRIHRAALHSAVGLVVACSALAFAFCALDKKLPASNVAQNKTYPPLTFISAFAVCAIGVAGHFLLDLVSGVGLKLLWPFWTRYFGWDLATNLDLWVLVILVVGLLLPMLFRLISEEVGDRGRRRGGSRAATVTLVLLVAYFGVRASLRAQAVNILLSHDYRGHLPLAAGAFPESSAPFDWRGVVVTDDTLEVLEVPVGPDADFESSRSLTFYKSEPSPALNAGQQTDGAKRFLASARFPLASVEPFEGGYRFEIHDLRFTPDDFDPQDIFLRVDFSSDLQVQSERFLFASAPNR